MHANPKKKKATKSTLQGLARREHRDLPGVDLEAVHGLAQALAHLGELEGVLRASKQASE